MKLRTALTEDEKKIVVEMYLAHTGIGTIARKLGVLSSPVDRLLKSLGIKRTMAEAQAVKLFDHNRRPAVDFE